MSAWKPWLPNQTCELEDCVVFLLEEEEKGWEHLGSQSSLLNSNNWSFPHVEYTSPLFFPAFSCPGFLRSATWTTVQQWPSGKSPGMILISSSSYPSNPVRFPANTHSGSVCCLLACHFHPSLGHLRHSPCFFLQCAGNIGEPPRIMWVLGTQTLVFMLVWWAFLSTELSPHPYAL